SIFVSLLMGSSSLNLVERELTDHIRLLPRATGPDLLGVELAEPHPAGGSFSFKGTEDNANDIICPRHSVAGWRENLHGDVAGPRPPLGRLGSTQRALTAGRMLN